MNRLLMTLALGVTLAGGDLLAAPPRSGSSRPASSQSRPASSSSRSSSGSSSGRSNYSAPARSSGGSSRPSGNTSRPSGSYSRPSGSSSRPSGNSSRPSGNYSRSSGNSSRSSGSYSRPAGTSGSRSTARPGSNSSHGSASAARPSGSRSQGANTRPQGGRTPSAASRTSGQTRSANAQTSGRGILAASAGRSQVNSRTAAVAARAQVAAALANRGPTRAAVAARAQVATALASRSPAKPAAKQAVHDRARQTAHELARQAVAKQAKAKPKPAMQKAVTQYLAQKQAIQQQTQQYLNSWPAGARGPNWDKVYNDITNRGTVDPGPASSAGSWDVVFTYKWGGEPGHHTFTSKADAEAFAAEYRKGVYSTADGTLTGVKVVPVAKDTSADRQQLVFDENAQRLKQDKQQNTALAKDVGKLIAAKYPDQNGQPDPQRTLRESLLNYEGVRQSAYLDSATKSDGTPDPKLTVGIGLNLQRAPADQMVETFRKANVDLLQVLAGRPLTAQQTLDLFEADVASAQQRARRYLGTATYNKLDPGRRQAIDDMAFNVSGLEKFRTLKADLQGAANADNPDEAAQYYHRAGQDMVQSKWYRDVGGRAEDLVNRMGVDYNEQLKMRDQWDVMSAKPDAPDQAKQADAKYQAQRYARQAKREALEAAKARANSGTPASSDTPSTPLP